MRKQILIDASEPRPPRTWLEALETIPPQTIAKVLKCPASTVYAWRSIEARRTPPVWLQDIILEKLREFNRYQED